MKQTRFVERVRQAYELSRSIFNRTILYIHFDQLKKWVSGTCGEVGKGRGGGGASAPVAPPLPTRLAFVNYFFTLEEFILTVESWVIMARWRDIERFL